MPRPRPRLSKTNTTEVTLGQIRGVFGVQGWVRVESWTEPELKILDYEPWQVQLTAGVRPFWPRAGRWQGPGLVVQLANDCGELLADRDEARALVGGQIVVPRSALAPLGPDEIYLADLPGMRVLDCDGHEIGVIRKMLDNGAQPVMCLDPGDVLIPFVRGEIVRSADVASGEVCLSWSRDDAL